jgi:hypothetical protein
MQCGLPSPGSRHSRLEKRQGTPIPRARITDSASAGEPSELASHSRDIPNPQAKYLTGGSTKAEVLVNNPKWFDVLDVSVVDGFNEKIQMNLTPTGGQAIQLGPPVGKLGNQKVFGVFPYACTICAGIKDAPCGDAGKGECKLGTESKPGVPCQYQMNEPNGLVEVLLLPK